MPFTRPSLSDLVTRIESDIETRLSEVGNLLRRSVLKTLARATAGVAHLVYGYLQYMSQQLFAATADTEYLELIGSEYGINRNAAAKATGTGTATGITGTTIPADTELQSATGNVYTIDSAVTLAAGTGIVEFTANVAGDDSNETGAVTLTFVSPINNINDTVTTTSDGITGGADGETDTAYRERVLTRKRRPPHGGAEFDYETWAKERSGITRAWVFPQYAGNGTVALAYTRDNDTSIIPNAADRADTLDYILEHTDPASGETVGIPVTAEPGFEILAVAEYTINFEINIYPNTTDVQDAVEEELTNLLYNSGGPGQTIYLSQISEAVGNAAGEERHQIVSPTTDIVATYTQVPVLGTVTFNAYPT